MSWNICFRALRYWVGLEHLGYNLFHNIFYTENLEHADGSRVGMYAINEQFSEFLQVVASN